MEFEDEHDNEEHEEEEDDEDEDEITIPPPAVPPSYVDSAPQHRVITPSPSTTDFRRHTAVRYRECLKNHAVNIGGHALDGCGEFMPAGDDGTLDALKCAACNCHRNFHRKEPDPTPPPPQHQPPQFSTYYRTPPQPPTGYLHHHHHRQGPVILPALPSSNTSGGTHSGDMADDVSHPSSSGGGGGGGSGGMMVGSGGGGGGGKKRHRTKFTQEQKDKMLGFAEKLGWRIQKHDEAAVQQFCAETLVRRQVLKVWMHNNKHTLGKKP